MATKVQVPQTQPGRLVRFFRHPVGKTLFAFLALIVTATLVLFTYYYAKYSRLIEAKLSGGPFANTSMLFATPRTVVVGDVTTPQEIAVQLRRAGYTESRKNRMGSYTLQGGEIDVYPGPDSYFRRDDGVIKFAGGKVARIISLGDNTERTEYAIEPELISNLFDKNRERHRLVRYEDIPQVLVHAVVSAEDKRFFQHSGFDPIRIVKSAYVDMKARQNAQGASTLSMQLAGMLFLDRSDRSWKRKLPEVLITMHLEQKLNKKQIFEFYANQVPLGHRGSFGIRGFGEAAQVYFGKDIGRLSIPESATLAGLIQQPSFSNPYRWPDRSRARRNVVLKMMHENGYINDKEFEDAVNSPLTLAHHNAESTDAPYFVDLVNDVLLEKFPDYDFQTNNYRIYTTLDLQLQRDAMEAVRIGMEEVDKRLVVRRKKDPNYPEPQCALVALDPATGEVKAIVGGRNYGTSQLNRVLAKRQPGSSFKPFVYAAAMNTGLKNEGVVVTPATMINDEPTTFWFDGKPYEPSNFERNFNGNIPVRYALAHSLNIPTVKVAEMIGYNAVVDVARRAGLNMDIHATPAVALGAYEVTPLEIAGGYTIFANRGNYSKPYFLSSINNDKGSEIFSGKPEHHPVLDPRVVFLMDNLLEEVLNSGTGAGVRGRGVNFAAAGKTGSSHDGWFAGFTSKLICVVWVGFDDNRDIKLEGAKSALPVWAEFMRRAHEHREYHNVSGFGAPAGIVSAQIDPASGQLATGACPKVRNEYFIQGTQPVEMCSLHGGGGTQIAGWETGQPARTATQPVVSGGTAQQREAARNAPPSADSPQSRQTPPQRKGIFGKIRDIFR